MLFSSMQHPDDGNKVYSLVSALIAAKLNRLAGNNDSDSPCNRLLTVKLSQATQWMTDHGWANGACGQIGYCAASDPCWQSNGERLYQLLDTYNNGQLYYKGVLCAAPRE